MNYTKEQLDTEVIRQIGISLLHAICVIFAMSFVPASFVIFHIDERVSKVYIAARVKVLRSPAWGDDFVDEMK